MKFKGAVLVVILLPVILITSFSAYAQPLQKEISIGLVPEINVFRQVSRYKPLEAYLTKKTGIKVNFNILTHYGDIIDYYLGMKLDGAFFGSLTAVLAYEKLEIEPILRQVNMDGTDTYHSYLFVRKDSGIKGVKDLKGKVMAYVDKATLAGYVFPVAYLRDNGVIDIKNYFSNYYFTGSHDAAIFAVLNGKADIAAVKNTIYDSLSKENPRIDKELVIIAESTKVPSNGLSLNKYIDESIRIKVKETLLNMDKDTEGKKVLQEFGAKKFIETTRDDFKGVFTILEKAGIDLSTYDYYNN